MVDESVECSRCGATLPKSEFPQCTAGYYDVSGEPWSRYATQGESIVCDGCMHTSEAYRKDYGWRR